VGHGSVLVAITAPTAARSLSINCLHQSGFCGQPRFAQAAACAADLVGRPRLPR
jgi:hypothetical protein